MMISDDDDDHDEEKDADADIKVLQSVPPATIFNFHSTSLCRTFIPLSFPLLIDFLLMVQ